MAGKRLYITIPHRDWRLMQRYGSMSGQCAGQLARGWVLTELYFALTASTDLQDYDMELARQEREEVLRGRQGQS